MSSRHSAAAVPGETAGHNRCNLPTKSPNSSAPNTSATSATRTGAGCQPTKQQQQPDLLAGEMPDTDDDGADAAEEARSFNTVNEHPVDQISLEFFYTPHRLLLLLVSIVAVMSCAFVRNDTDPQANVWSGMLCATFFFLIVSVIAFPNGPFTRPHPAFWRILFGVSVLYLLGIQFLMFQNYATIKEILYWMDVKLRDFHIDMDREYAVGCNEVTLAKLWQYVDVYAASHFFGCFVKALLVRHMGVLWTISLMWEFTEMAFAHLLPNFLECWWDSFVLDVLVCNGLGYWAGMRVCRMFEMREYRWESIRDISSTSGKIKRAVLQFTPASWSDLRWFETGGEFTYRRFWGVFLLVIFCQVTELNTFFLKHIFELPAAHPLVITRLVLIGLFVAPSVRQYFVYISDSRCKRLGTQCWVYGAVMVSEAVLCVKNARDLFVRTQARNVVCWLLLQMLLSVVCLYGCVLWGRFVAASRRRRCRAMNGGGGSEAKAGDAQEVVTNCGGNNWAAKSD